MNPSWFVTPKTVVVSLPIMAMNLHGDCRYHHWPWTNPAESRTLLVICEFLAPLWRDRCSSFVRRGEKSWPLAGEIQGPRGFSSKGTQMSVHQGGKHQKISKGFLLSCWPVRVVILARALLGILQVRVESILFILYRMNMWIRVIYSTYWHICFCCMGHSVDGRS